MHKLSDRASRDSEKPRGGYKMALFGAQTRRRLLNLIDEVEAEIGQYAFAIAEDTGAMEINPKLIERLRNEPDCGVLEPAFDLAFPSPASKRRFNEEWSYTTGKYRGQRNSEELLREKSAILVSFVINNLDVAATTYSRIRANAPDLGGEAETLVRVEEATLWYRVIDELAQRYLGPDRLLFMAYFQDWLAHRLALQGASLELILITMLDRTTEYGKYQKWIPNDDEGTGGTLLWEAAKHIGEPLDCATNPLFLVLFVSNFVDRLLNEAMVYELMTGKLPQLFENKIEAIARILFTRKKLVSGLPSGPGRSWLRCRS
jgi:hypothetical protein